ncbi:uncharacterized protein LOC109803408 isoform X1 [Cajanus cajan]|uniref:uncharacterized protein LOC109803408 isoform X1 n=1 Tax=Cajanus cajan TaxID=3821 RepID=UPI00098D8F94|nr:uncharacterized protein LOC109803408 isoform X1 [Cajanus cajan]
MYRSFLTCDDPKGVVECGTIGKYRTRYHKMKNKTKIRKTRENLETSLMNKRYKQENKVPKGCDGNLIGPSSLQLTQVSGGDQSLNNMIDSWSRDLIYDGKSEDIANGILNGALGLQGSLIMLRKLQGASPYTASFRRKQTKKPERDIIDAKMIGGTQANPFREQSNPKGFQRPQPSAGGSSSNCKEELKKVIKESLVRKNMFPKMINEGLNSASETFSTSRTNSSLSDPSFSVIASKMERGTSLVVKLMGLEEAPSKSFPAVKQELLDGEIDMSKVRKNDSIAKKVNPEQRAQRETLDTMHFKRLLRKSLFKEPKLHVHHFDDTNSKHFDDLSNITLMKPQCTLYQESVKSTYVPVPPKELSITKLKAEIASSKTIKQGKGSSSTNMEKDVRKWLKKGPKFLKEVMKLDAKGNNHVEESSDKVKLYCHIGHTSQVNETIDKKWKVHAIGRKHTEKDIPEPPIVTIPQHQRETTSTKLRKLKSGSRIDKNEISCLNSTGSKNISISRTESQKINNSEDLNIEIKFFDSVVDSLTGRKNHMKNQSPVAEPEQAKVEQIRQGDEKKNYTEIRIASTLEDELLMVCEADASIINKNGEKCKQRKNFSGNDIIMLLKSEHENADKEGTELKHFLLTNPSFIGHAKKLFNLDMDFPNMPQNDETNYSTGNLRLDLDCAYELIEHKSLQESQVVRSFLLACRGNSRLHISLGRLVEEICNGIENLKFYREVIAGNVFGMMEKDIKSNGVISSTWERGWRPGYCADEAELVVNRIESMLLSGLIEELIINL